MLLVFDYDSLNLLKFVKYLIVCFNTNSKMFRKYVKYMIVIVYNFLQMRLNLKTSCSDRHILSVNIIFCL